tara:strand:- start:7824 stop:8354 length:531 start_codon:yes stop_codon:yes gene_type:complete
MPVTLSGLISTFIPRFPRPRLPDVVSLVTSDLIRQFTLNNGRLPLRADAYRTLEWRGFHQSRNSFDTIFREVAKPLRQVIDQRESDRDVIPDYDSLPVSKLHYSRSNVYFFTMEVEAYDGSGFGQKTFAMTSDENMSWGSALNEFYIQNESNFQSDETDWATLRFDGHYQPAPFGA